jgi:misacylated tRNA(Ala) deacylase
MLEVMLHDTVIFPEGGGQPYDIGTITTHGGTKWQVVNCKRHGGLAVHYVKVNDTSADAAHFSVGAKVVVALGPEGFTRRYDHVGHFQLRLP